MKKKLLLLLLITCVLIATVIGCSKFEQETPATGEQVGATNPPKMNQPKAPESTTKIFTDSVGRKIEVPAEITRIVPSGATAQMVLFALAPDLFVGVSSDWSKEAEQYINTKYYQLPVLGQFYGSGDLNLEQIAKADPQVIIDIGESKKSVAEDMDGIMKQVGIPTVHIEATTETMPEAYRTLGKLLNREEKAEELAKYCEEIYGKTLDIMKQVGENGKANLLYLAGEDGLNVIAKDTFHAEILDIVSNNLAVVENPSSKGTGTPIDMEQLLLWEPDTIIFAPNSAYGNVDKNPAWKELSAISSGKYYEVPFGPYNWMGHPPSVNRYIGMVWITQLLYPEVAQYDMQKETARYYKLFYDCDLTGAQYKALVTNSVLK